MVVAHAKNWYKRFLFDLNVKSRFLVPAFYRYLYRPTRGSFAEFIDRYSRSKGGKITVLQIGANDGFFHDPLYKFIRRDHWRGVLLEPQKKVYQDFLTRLHRNSDGIITMNAALDQTDGEKIIYKIAFSEARWATGLTSFKRSVINEAIDSGHVARSAHKEGIALPEKREDYIAEERVQCISLPSLMKMHSLSPLDWVQIDAEGYDYEIIKTIDLYLHKPTVIAFEHTHLEPQEMEACYRHLDEHHYSIARIRENTVAMQRAATTGFERFFNATPGA